MSNKKRRAGWVLVGALTLTWLCSLPQPSNDRDWVPNQAILPTAEVEGQRVRIRNVRNTLYESVEVYEPRYEDRVYDLSRLVRAWYVVEPFSDFGGAAHTFLSFEFEDVPSADSVPTTPDFVAISVEIRKEKGEAFSPVRGLFRQYEVMYVIADERDAIGLRANHRRDDVYLYPIAASPDKVRALFVSMLETANHLAEHPQFYNTLTNTCTTNIVRHVNALTPGRIPWSPRVLLPGYSDRLAYDLGIIDTELPFEEIRSHFRVNDQAARWAGRPGFSVGIRQGL